MIYLALDEGTNDLIFGETGPTRVEEGRYTIQQVRSVLRTRLGEYPPQLSVGFISRTDFEKAPDLLDIETRARIKILGVRGVKSIDELTLTLDQRKVTITFTATTEYGVIYDTVPWGIDI